MGATSSSRESWTARASSTTASGAGRRVRWPARWSWANAPMPALLLSALAAFLLSLLLTPGLRHLLRPRPGQAVSRARAGGIPRLGSLAVLAAAALALGLRAGLHWGLAGQADLPVLRQLAGPAFIVLAVGV